MGASRFSTDDAVRCPYFATAAATAAARYKGRREGGREGLAASPVPPTMKGFWFGRDTEADTLYCEVILKSLKSAVIMESKAVRLCGLLLNVVVSPIRFRLKMLKMILYSSP